MRNLGMSTSHQSARAKAKRPSEPGRKTIALTEQDLADLERLRKSPPAAERLGVSPEVSERAFLTAAIRRGLDEAREAEAAAGYAALACDPQERAIAQQERARVRRTREREDRE